MAVSVRTLCEFAARQGCLDNRYTPTPSAEDGRAAHATVQQRRNGNYQAEYALSGSFAGVDLRGRADGYREQHTHGIPWLEEIKSHRGRLEKLNQHRRALHWAQLKVYGALLCQRDGLSKVQLNLCYVDIDNDTEHDLTDIFDADSLLDFAVNLCEAYFDWHTQEGRHREKRDEGLLNLNFCYAEFRSGQRALAEDAYKTVALAKIALIEAPTGLGKTLGVLYPHLNAMARHNIDRLYLLSNQNTGKTLWQDALAQLSVQDHIRMVQLDAKQNACDHPDLACHGESCPLARGFFDKLPAARQDAASSQWLDSTTLAAIAAKHDLCRYYLAQEMARWSDIIIADINHLLDQQALLYALQQQNNWRVSVCIDEAHNTIERARGMFSAQLDEIQLLQYAKRAPVALKTSINQLKKAWRQLLKGVTADKPTYLEAPPDTLIQACRKFASQAVDYIVDNPGDGELQELMFACLGFAKLADSFGDHSLIKLQTATSSGTRYLRGNIAIQNIDPSEHIRRRWEFCHSVLLFSATLQPFEYYCDLLGIAGAVTRAISSPFSRQQLELRIVTDIDTRFQYRQHSAASIASRIAWQYLRKPGNYLIYTPSFAYQALLINALENLSTPLPIIQQTRSMNDPERQRFITQFKQQRGLIGLATMGGIFGEGIDLPGEELSGVYVVSLGLPPFDDYHQRVAEHLSARYGAQNGYRYTYLYPAMRKVIQAAGRLLRSQEDQGLIELIDPRFEQAEIKSLLPVWWF
jgi:DNA excision repair protein ERCC-2